MVYFMECLWGKKTVFEYGVDDGFIIGVLLRLDVGFEDGAEYGTVLGLIIGYECGVRCGFILVL